MAHPLETTLLQPFSVPPDRRLGRTPRRGSLDASDRSDRNACLQSSTLFQDLLPRRWASRRRTLRAAPPSSGRPPWRVSPSCTSRSARRTPSRQTSSRCLRLVQGQSCLLGLENG